MFRFKDFSLFHERSTLKIGTDSVLLSAAVPLNNVSQVLDVGCGCGVITFCIANRLQKSASQEVTLTGIDIDADSVTEAVQNSKIFPKTQKEIKFDFQHISIQEYAQIAQNRFDLVVSNPPFFSHSLKPEEENRLKSKHRDEVLPFESLIQATEKILSPDGRFYVILPFSELADFEINAKYFFHICEKMLIQSVPHKLPNRVILGMSKLPVIYKESSLTIRDENHSFTEEYKQLTHNYYLDF